MSETDDLLREVIKGQAKTEATLTGMEGRQDSHGRKLDTAAETMTGIQVKVGKVETEVKAIKEALPPLDTRVRDLETEPGQTGQAAGFNRTQIGAAITAAAATIAGAIWGIAAALGG